jgi:addiction module RelB/DinJ family antitoxin
MSKVFLQVRTNAEDKEQASTILDGLGTNLSSVVNMLLKQIIMTKSIPFEVKMPQVYSNEEKIAEIQASMAMEDMQLTNEDTELLQTYQKTSDRERIRNQLVTEYTEV